MAWKKSGAHTGMALFASLTAVLVLAATTSPTSAAEGERERPPPRISFVGAPDKVIQEFCEATTGIDERQAENAAWLLVGDAYEWGKLDPLEKAAVQWVEAHPKDTGGRLLLSVISAYWPTPDKEQKIDAALTGLLTAAPQSVRGREWSAARLAANRRWDEARDMYRSITQDKPPGADLVAAYEGLACASTELKDTKTALEAIGAMLAAAPDNAAVTARAGELYMLAGSKDKAVECLDTAAKQATGVMVAQIKLHSARVYLRAGMAQEAKRILAQLQQLPGEASEAVRKEATALAQPVTAPPGGGRGALDAGDRPPIIPRLTPHNGSVTNESKPTISFSAVGIRPLDPWGVRLFIDGRDVTHLSTVAKGVLTCTPADKLSDGGHLLTAVAGDQAGKVTLRTCALYVDTEPPTAPTIVYPKVKGPWKTVIHTEQVMGKCAPDTASIKATCETAPVVAFPQSPWYVQIGQMKVGRHTLRITALDKAGNESQPVELVVEYAKPDAKAPEVILGPAQDLNVKRSDIVLTGTVSKPAEVIIEDLYGQRERAKVAGQPNARGLYEWTVPQAMQRGCNIVRATATARDGAVGRDVVNYVLPVIEIPKDRNIASQGKSIRDWCEVYFYVYDWPDAEAAVVSLQFPDGHIEPLADTNFCLWNTREIRYNTPRFPNGQYRLIFKVSYGADERHVLTIGP